MMAYAMLFNQNLEYFQFIDDRGHPKDISFSIERNEYRFIAKGFYSFTYTLNTEFNHEKGVF